VCSLDCLDKDEQKLILKEYNSKTYKYKSPYLKKIRGLINSKCREFNMKLYFNNKEDQIKGGIENASMVIYNGDILKGDIKKPVPSYQIFQTFNSLSRDERKWILWKISTLNGSNKLFGIEYDKNYVVIYFKCNGKPIFKNEKTDINYATKIIYNGIVLKDIYNKSTPINFYDANNNPSNDKKIIYSINSPYINFAKIKEMYENVVSVKNKPSESELEKLRAANKILKIKLAYAEEIIAKCMKG